MLVGFPLIIRRRAPLVPVVLLMTAVAVQAVATSDAAEGAPLLFPALACAYAVAAYGTRRIAVAGLLVPLAGLAVQVAFDPLARTPEQSIDLYRVITTLNLDVKTIAPAHGAGPKPFDDLKKHIGLIPL